VRWGAPRYDDAAAWAHALSVDPHIDEVIAGTRGVEPDASEATTDAVPEADSKEEDVVDFLRWPTLPVTLNGNQVVRRQGSKPGEYLTDGTGTPEEVDDVAAEIAAEAVASPPVWPDDDDAARTTDDDDDWLARYKALEAAKAAREAAAAAPAEAWASCSGCSTRRSAGARCRRRSTASPRRRSTPRAWRIWPSPRSFD